MLSHDPAVDPRSVAASSGTIVDNAARNPAAYDGFVAATSVVDRSVCLMRRRPGVISADECARDKGD
jgi:hypothetical protein